MTTAVANSEELPLGRFVAYSLVLHAALAATIVGSIFFKFKGDQWAGLGGDPGQSINVTMVPSAGIPMPQPPAITDAKAFDPTDGLYKETPQPKPPAPPPDATPIPKLEKDKPVKPPPPSPPSKVFEPKKLGQWLKEPAPAARCGLNL